MNILTSDQAKFYFWRTSDPAVIQDNNAGWFFDPNQELYIAFKGYDWIEVETEREAIDWVYQL